MLDLAAGIEERNYGLRRTTDPRALMESLRIVLPFVVIAGALSFHIWVRSQSIYIGYQNQQLNAQEEELLQIRQQFILEEQTLKDPQWLEAIARKDLGMVILQPNQIIPPPLENWNAGHSGTPELGNLIHSSEPKRSSAFN
jgi:cell division protein FtsL